MSVLDGWIARKLLRCSKRERAMMRKEFLGAKPFPHIALNNFLLKNRYAQLKIALEKQTFSRKEADLFSFSQTDNLFACNDPCVHEFLHVIASDEFAKLLCEITGEHIGVKRTKPSSRVDAAGFSYGDTDHLLCHDDGVSSRRIAYVLNLSTMHEHDGGGLALFNSNSQSEPTAIAKRIHPRENTLVLFLVSDHSHHMVEEVVGKKRRLTIAGWFHA